jgi:hypothetical protein
LRDRKITCKVVPSYKLAEKNPWPSGYDCYIAMENGPFFSSVNHLFRLGPSIPWLC